MNIAAAKVWLLHHRTQALVAGGAGVAGLALYNRHRGTAGQPPPATATSDTGGTAGDYGDPGSAAPTFSDVDAALLDADLTGIAGTLDGIRRTLNNLNPVKRRKKKPHHPAKKKAHKKAHKKSAAKKTAKKRTPPHKKPPRTKADQQRRARRAAYSGIKLLPGGKAGGPPRRSLTPAMRGVANPHPAGRRKIAAPIATPAHTKRTLANHSPRPAAPRRAVPRGRR